jgi:hypothetical protein
MRRRRAPPRRSDSLAPGPRGQGSWRAGPRGAQCGCTCDDNVKNNKHVLSCSN